MQHGVDVDLLLGGNPLIALHCMAGGDVLIGSDFTHKDIWHKEERGQRRKWDDTGDVEKAPGRESSFVKFAAELSSGVGYSVPHDVLLSKHPKEFAAYVERMHATLAGIKVL